MMGQRPLLLIIFTTALTRINAGTWTELTMLPAALQAPFVETVGSSLYVYGGKDNTLAVSAGGSRYTPSTSEWVFLPNMPTARWKGASAVVSSHIYCVGGLEGTDASTISNLVEYYKPESSSWATRASLPEGRYGHGAATVYTTVSGKVLFVVGGMNPSSIATTTLFSMEVGLIGTWSTLDALPVAMTNAFAAAIGLKLYVSHGMEPSTFSAQANLRCYTVSTSSWTTLPAVSSVDILWAGPHARDAF